MRRHSTLPFLLLSGAAMLWGCGKKELPDLTVGVIAELSGDIPAVGASCKNAAEMAVAELNDAGGVKVAGKDYRLRLMIEDSKGAASEAVEATKRLVKDDRSSPSWGRTPASAPCPPRRWPRTRRSR